MPLSTSIWENQYFQSKWSLWPRCSYNPIWGLKSIKEGFKKMIYVKRTNLITLRNPLQSVLLWLCSLDSKYGNTAIFALFEVNMVKLHFETCERNRTNFLSNCKVIKFCSFHINDFWTLLWYFWGHKLDCTNISATTTTYSENIGFLKW